MNTQPNQTMKWLIRREMWEHKGGALYAPLIAGAITLLLTMLATAITQWDVGFDVKGVDLHTLMTTMARQNPEEAGQVLAKNYLALALPVFIPLGFVVFFYSLAAMHDERKDRSILFWKSLPVSDQATVASKAIFALIVAPLITAGLAFGFACLGLLWALGYASIQGVHLWGVVFSQQELYWVPFQLFYLVPVYALLALPTVGWLMLMSASVRSPFLWGVGMPLALLVASALSGLDGVAAKVVVEGVSHLLGGTLPLFSMANPMGGEGFIQNLLNRGWSALMVPSVWGWAMVGTIMLRMAALVRRMKGETL